MRILQDFVEANIAEYVSTVQLSSDLNKVEANRADQVLHLLLVGNLLLLRC